MAEFTACNACAQAVVRDGNGLILEGISKVVLALGHSSHKDTDALFRSQCLDEVSHFDNFSIETESDFAAIWRKVVCDGVLDDLQELLLRVDTPDRQLVKKLDHETSESLESSRYTDCRRHFDKHTFGSMNVDL